MTELDVSGTHSRDEIAEHLENIAANLRRGEPIQLRTHGDGENQEATLNPPANTDFKLDVDRDRSLIGGNEETELEIELSWKEEQKEDDEKLSVQ